MEQPRKNLVLIHLESISNTILWQYRVELETIWRIMQGSLFYQHYNASATSTAMCINAVFTGNSALNDCCHSFRADSPYSDLVGTIMNNFEEDFGYTCSRIFYDPFLLEPPGKNVQLCHHLQMAYQQVDALFQNCGAENKNFFLAFTDYSSHMTYEDEHKVKAEGFSDRFRAGYIHVNATTSQVLALLAEHGFWDDTIIAFYGDHGDELWSHAFKNGRCHTVEPYASLTSTPFFIFDNGEHVGLSEQLVSTEDLRETLLKRLFPEYQPTGKGKAFRTIPFSGIDINKEEREYSFSQSIYALQKEYGDPEDSVIKSYAVTNGELRLVATYGERDPDNSGMELYYDQFDPTNSRNLLDFFHLDDNGDIVEFNPPPLVDNSPFSKAFNPEEVDYLTGSYASLKKVLVDTIKAKEAEALKVNSANFSLMADSVFTKARKRIRNDFDV